MKKIILSALLIGLLTACTNDKTDSEESAKSITGKWQTLKMEMYTNDKLEGSEVFQQENNSCPDYTEFKSDGSCQSVNMDANCADNTQDLGTYTFDGSTLKLTNGEESETHKVTSVTATEFVIEVAFSEDGFNYKNKVFFKKLN